MSDLRLAHKIEETRKLASDQGLDLVSAPLVVTFELPIWGSVGSTHEIGELARMPGTAVAVMSVDPLPEVRRALESTPYLHCVAERGLVCGLSGGATLHAYPNSSLEMQSFAVALFAGGAPENLRLALSAYVSSGRQDAFFESRDRGPTAREILHAIRNRGGTAILGSDESEAVIVDDVPAELGAVRDALACDLAGRCVRVSRMPSGRFRFMPGGRPRPIEARRLHIMAQEIAISCDRFIEVRGESAFGFVTEPVARWRYGPEMGARRLAAELFDAPDTVITHLGLHPFRGEGTLFFAYEGSETVWEAANKGVACVTVRDMHEYGRIVHTIRKGE